VGVKTVFVTEGPDSRDHVEGLDYCCYPTGIVIYHVKTADDTGFEDVLGHHP